MELKTVQTLLSQTADPKTGSAQFAVRQLRAAVEKTQQYLGSGNTAKAQRSLEQGFTLIVQAMHYLNLDLENVVNREQARHQGPAELQSERVIFVFGDHAELRVDGELRGTIPLYAAEDYQELDQIAQLFQCRIEQANHVQLDLFTALTQSKNESA